jgi:hypothetical protein
MAMKKKPQGKFTAGKVEAPRKVTINGETHYLVYVTPEEAKGLKKAGGSGQAGPKGIPAYPVGSVNKEKVDRAKAKMASKPAPKPKPAPSGGSGGGGSDSGQANNPPPSGGNNNNSGGGGGGGSDSGQANNPPPSGGSGGGGSDSGQANNPPSSGGNNTSTPRPPTPRPPASNDGPSAAEKAAAAARVKSLADAKERAKAFADAKAKAEAEAQALADSKAKAEAEAKVKAVVDPKVDTTGGVAGVKTNVPFKGTMKDGVLLDRLGNPVVTNAKGYGYLDPLTGLAVTPWTDSINGGGPGYGGAAFGSGGGAALDTNKDNYISEAEIAAGKAKGLELEQNAWSKFGTGLGITPLGSGIDPTGIAGFADSGILGFARKLGAPGYVRPDSSIAPGQELNKWWEADKNALGFAYGTQDEISQRRADAKGMPPSAAASSRNNE